MSPPTGWSFLPGRFTDDPLTDVVGYHSGDGELWVGKFRYLGIEGYCWPLSAAPGEQIDFHLSSDGIVDVAYLRHVADADGVRSDQVGSDQTEPGVQPTPALAWRDGCGWPPSLQLTIPDEWESGMYSARCDNANGNTTYVTFIVKPRRRPPIRVGRAGQRQHLAGVQRLGWRPRSTAVGRGSASCVRARRPSPIGTGFENMHLARAELWILGWLTDEGYRPDVYTDIDFHNGIDLTSYRCLVVGTHPEYWTTGMYDRLVNYLDSGGSLLYLGGNGIFEIGAYTDDQTRMSVLAGCRIRGLGPRPLPPADADREPERTVLGVTTERCAVNGSPYEVLLADHPMFAGTGMSNGDAVRGLRVEHGVRQRQGQRVGGRHRRRAGSSWPSGGLQLRERSVAGLAAPRRAGGAGPSHARSGRTRCRHDVLPASGGGIVFSAGSLTFGGSLVVSPAIQQIVRNAIAETGVTI